MSASGRLVSTWRFRLGTECDGPRIGHSWLNFTEPNPPFVMADGRGGSYTSRVNGLDKYVETCESIAAPLASSTSLLRCPLTWAARDQTWQSRRHSMRWCRKLHSGRPTWLASAGTSMPGLAAAAGQRSAPAACTLTSLPIASRQLAPR